MSLQQQQSGAAGPLSDLELARQLQQEEYQNQQQVSVQAATQVRPARPCPQSGVCKQEVTVTLYDHISVCCHGDDVTVFPVQKSGVTTGWSQKKRQRLRLCCPIESSPSSSSPLPAKNPESRLSAHTRTHTHSMPNLSAFFVKQT